MAGFLDGQDFQVFPDILKNPVSNTSRSIPKTKAATNIKMLHISFAKTILQLFREKIGKQTRQSLALCKIALCRELTLICPDESTADAVYDCAEDLAAAAYRLGLQSAIQVKVGTEFAFSIPTDILFKLLSAYRITQ